MLTDHARWLRREREARGWSKREMARRLIQAGKDAGDKTMPDARSVYLNVLRWERGAQKPTERYRLYYCAALGITPDQFGLAPPEPGAEPQAVIRAVPSEPLVAGPPLANPAVRNLVDPRLLASIAVAYRGIYGSDMGRFMVEREVQMTAHEGSDQAEQAELPGISDVTMGQLRADVTRLIRLHDTGEPFAVFLEMRRVRERIYGLLDRRLRPREQTDLYFLLGCINGAMGGTANYLGYPEAAEELIRAGWAYANAIGHHPLQGLLRLELSIVMYERGRFDDSRDLAVSGLTFLPAGPQGADLHIRHAQAVARLGDADTARRAVQEAHEARAPGYTDELQEMGGKFFISRATHHCFAGAALATLPSAEREAAAELERAIGFYDEGPGEREQHWFAGKPLAGINLAMVRLRSGALDAAEAALEPALSLPAAQRITRVTTRLAAVRDQLAAPIFRGSAQARALGEQIEEFGRETIVTGLHSLPGAPN